MSESFKEKLIILRDDYRDEIPEEIVRDWDPVTKFKVRSTWYQAVVGRLRLGIITGAITDPVVIKKIDRGIKRFTSERFQDRDRTTAREIKYANMLIEFALKNASE